MKPFAYVSAQSPASAAELVLEHGGRYLAGGVDLLGELKDDLVEAPVLVDVKSLPGTRDIVAGAAEWTFGANVTVATLAAHAGVRAAFPGLAEAAAEVASPQIRNAATLGGNLAQHSRCWYYRHRDVQCLKNGGATCYAREGQNKYHALFSGNPCISPVVSNLGVALAALDAAVEVLRDGAATRLTVAQFYADAWVNPYAHHSLRPGDLVLRVHVPVRAGQRSAYLQASEKADFDWALVSCAAAAIVEGRTVRQARVALGAVSPVPHQRPAVTAVLEGQELTDELAARAAAALLRGAQPLAHNGYKIPLAETLVQRALLKLVA